MNNNVRAPDAFDPQVPLAILHFQHCYVFTTCSDLGVACAVDRFSGAAGAGNALVVGALGLAGIFAVSIGLALRTSVLCADLVDASVAIAAVVSGVAVAGAVGVFAEIPRRTIAML